VAHLRDMRATPEHQSSDGAAWLARAARVLSPTSWFVDVLPDVTYVDAGPTSVMPVEQCPQYGQLTDGSRADDHDGREEDRQRSDRR